VQDRRQAALFPYHRWHFYFIGRLPNLIVSIQFGAAHDFPDAKKACNMEMENSFRKDIFLLIFHLKLV